MTLFHSKHLHYTGRFLTIGTLLVFMAVQLFAGTALQANAAAVAPSR